MECEECYEWIAEEDVCCPHCGHIPWSEDDYEHDDDWCYQDDGDDY